MNLPEKRETEASPASKPSGAGLKAFGRLMFLKEFMLLASSTVLSQGSKFVVFMSAARILGPRTWGLWNMLHLIIAYSCVAHLGVINGMNRDVPIFKGKGDFDKADQIRRVSLGTLSVLGFAFSALLGIVALFLPYGNVRTYLLLMPLLVICTQIYTYLQTFLRSDKRFAQQSYQLFVFAGLFPAVAIPLVLRWGLSGLIIGQSLTILALSFFITRIVPFDFRLQLKVREALRLVKIGFPIMVGALLYGFLTTADRWVITSFFGTEKLGHYSISIMVMMALTMVPLVTMQQIYPRMAEAFGRTASHAELKKWIYRQAFVGLGITVPMAAAAFFIFPLIVVRFLPAYVPGIPAMRIILFGLPFLPFSWGFGNFLVTVGKQVYCMAIQGSAVLANLALNIFFVRLGWGINGVALGTALAYILYSLAMVAAGLIVMKKGSKPPGNVSTA